MRRRRAAAFRVWRRALNRTREPRELRVETVECVVVGAGVVGLAVARALALGGREVMVLEQEPGIGAHTSSRNSEVIHAGLYYKKGSLRALLFPRARDLMYAYCAEHGVPHRRIGKLTVARDA